ncbi:hypothetical protein GALMADRAFT_420443 [Galerina marginata CBS 339.88]|uniref:F-box domain-containing protein n=1 Tax=Galerina marginata (strain CBS 339.88) TaxID=685588 RepID=A0A067TAR3_GALM3|nr:hypothetical protein GALMADRAFT_420443 [Galerina marginata CBS 339.88]
MSSHNDNDLSQDRLHPVPNRLIHPISALHHDMLYEIFLWNADMFDDEYLPDAIRQSSQVCRAWRSCLLNSPDIWGRLIDLAVLDQKTDFWRDEILRRSGNSMLEISGSVSHAKFQVYKPVDLFFFSILDSHWARIRHFRIRIRKEVPTEKDLWSPLLRPAPNLQTFTLNLNRGVLGPLSPSTIPLFSDHAPILYHFTAEFLLVSLTAPWLSHLCTLHLPSRFSVSAVLSALYSMKRLEFLTIDGFSRAKRDNASPSLPVVMLPHLKSLIVEEKRLPLGILIDFLTHVHYADQCGVRFDGMVDSMSPTKLQDLEAYCTLFPSILQRYLSTHTVSSLDFYLTTVMFNVWDWDELRLGIIFNGAWLPTDYYELFASVPSSYDFSSVTNLNLKLGPPSTPYPVVSPTTLSSFSGVTSLHADLETLRSIIFMRPSNLKGPTCAAFPLLQEIVLEDTDFINADDDTTPIAHCIYGRVGSGKPTFKLDLGLASDWSWGFNAHLGSELESLTGLRVIWSTDSGKHLDYICGSGVPESILSRT